MEDYAYSIGVSDGPTERLKVPPQSIEAEQSVLGGLMLDNQRWDQIADKVHADDFYRKEHRLIFRAIAALCDESQPADVITVSEWLEKNAELEDAGGLSYLGALANNTPSAANSRPRSCRDRARVLSDAHEHVVPAVSWRGCRR